MSTCFVTPRELGDALDEKVLVDCRFRLTDPDWGRAAYHQQHAAGAVYAHLDHDLSDLSAGPGRHPLPHPDRLQQTLRGLGIEPDSQVVVYDDASGAIAARLWWLLRYAGHEQVAILDGGWPAWLEAGLPVESGAGSRSPGRITVEPGAMPWVSTRTVAERPPEMLLLDARSPERFRGESEPIDPVAGTVPGAANRPFEDNLDQGKLLPLDQLRTQWGALLGQRSPQSVIHMCGSGVTACFNLACMEHLGQTGSALYVDSFSGWIADSANPVSHGGN
ncbi:MAG: sulfurtransferase [Xanthomonadales bacterium]|nr:sulfurtransferase [Xanthomonadales bacterium]